MQSLAGKWIVETDWLSDHLDAPDLVVLDGTWHMPGGERNAAQEYGHAHIPGAIFFDIDDIADETSDLPHMLPSTVKFASRMKKMGIGDGMQAVVYNAPSSFTAARSWWMFRAMGFENVAVLNGGLGKWRAEKRAITDELPPIRSARHFTPHYNAQLVADKDDVLAVLADGSAQILDARPAPRFDGTAEETRPGLRNGHIPGSLNLPAAKVFNRDETFKSPEELGELFKAVGVDTSKPIVTTCGSGVTASILALALARIGNTNTAVYDGSWMDWGADAALPIETGAVGTG